MVTAALVIVDVQNDFLPGGALAVPRGDEVVPTINRLMRRFACVIASQDWHPPDHGSFADVHAGKQPGDLVALDGLEQVLWPAHCVQGTRGAELARGLNRERIDEVIRKGTDRLVDSYSAFFDNAHRRQTELDACLRKHAVERLYLAGLATDYCVKFTALDARQLGWPTALVTDACRGIERNRGDIARAIDEMRGAGVAIITSKDVPGPG